MRLIILLTAFIFSCSVLPMAGNDPLETWFPFSDDFTSPSSRWHKEVANDNAITSDTTAIVGNNTAKSKIVVAPSDVANHGNRAELAIYNCGQYLDTMYYGFDFLVPSSDPDNYTWQILSQWYQLPDFEHGESFELQYPHPPLTLTLEPGKLVLMGNVPSEVRLLEQNINKNQWYRVVLKIKYDTTENGEVEVYFGAPGSISLLSAPMKRATIHNKAGIYWKLGLYRGFMGQTQAAGTNTVYIDNVKIDRSLAGVQ